MKYALLPTPRDVELSPDTRVAVGSASPVTTAPEVDDGLRRGLEDWLRARGDGRLPVVVTRDAGLGPEASRLCVTEQAVELTASDAVGWRHALDRLRQLGGPYGELPLGRIADAPALAMRGFHLNFNIPTLDFEAGKRVLESMARWRLNTVLLEYDRRYPYDAHGAIAAPDALTRPEVRALVDHARALGIEPIPLQQCLGHVNYILRHEAYARLYGAVRPLPRPRIPQAHPGLPLPGILPGARLPRDRRADRLRQHQHLAPAPRLSPLRREHPRLQPAYPRRRRPGHRDVRLVSRSPGGADAGHPVHGTVHLESRRAARGVMGMFSCPGGVFC